MHENLKKLNTSAAKNTSKDVCPRPSTGLRVRGVKRLKPISTTWKLSFALHANRDLAISESACFRPRTRIRKSCHVIDLQRERTMKYVNREYRLSTTRPRCCLDDALHPTVSPFYDDNRRTL